jgi:hypothetical protein
MPAWGARRLSANFPGGIKREEIATRVLRALRPFVDAAHAAGVPLRARSVFVVRVSPAALDVSVTAVDDLENVGTGFRVRFLVDGAEGKPRGSIDPALMRALLVENAQLREDLQRIRRRRRALSASAGARLARAIAAEFGDSRFTASDTWARSLETGAEELGAAMGDAVRVPSIPGVGQTLGAIADRDLEGLRVVRVRRDFMGMYWRVERCEVAT